MKYVVLFIPILFTFNCLAQKKYLLITESSSEVIPYASIYIKNEKTGTSSDLKGIFSISLDKNDTLIVSSVGFKSLVIPFSEMKDTVEMEIDVQLMREVEVLPKKKRSRFNQKNTIEGLNKGLFSTKVWMGSEGKPLEIARYFKFKPEYNQTPYIHQVSFNTMSMVNNALFSIKFYKPDENALPGRLLNKKMIIAEVKKGRHKTSTQIEDQLIAFPKEGLFIAVEYLNLDQNKYLKNLDSQLLYKDYAYGYSPIIGLSNSVKNELFMFYYKKGTWVLSKDFKNELACEVILIE